MVADDIEDEIPVDELEDSVWTELDIDAKVAALDNAWLMLEMVLLASALVPPYKRISY